MRRTITAAERRELAKVADRVWLLHETILDYYQRTLDVLGIHDEDREDPGGWLLSFQSHPAAVTVDELLEHLGVRVASDGQADPPTEPTFVIGATNGTRYIRCLVCNATSFSPGDIDNRYCGRCRKYHPIRQHKEDRS